MSLVEGRCRECDCSACMRAFPLSEKQLMDGVAEDLKKAAERAYEAYWHEAAGEYLFDVQAMTTLAMLLISEVAEFARHADNALMWAEFLGELTDERS